MLQLFNQLNSNSSSSSTSKNYDTIWCEGQTSCRSEPFSAESVNGAEGSESSPALGVITWAAVSCGCSSAVKRNLSLVSDCVTSFSTGKCSF